MDGQNFKCFYPFPLKGLLFLDDPKAHFEQERSWYTKRFLITPRPSPPVCLQVCRLLQKPSLAKTFIVLKRYFINVLYM